MGHVNSVLLAISKSPNPTVFQKTLGVNDFYFGDDEFEYPMGHISFVGKLDAIALSAGAPADRAGHDARHHGEAFARLLADVRGSARPEQPRHARSRRQHRPVVHAEQRRGPQASDQEAGAPAPAPGHAPASGAAESVRRQRIPLAGVAHQNGTIRFGRDPKTSALDANCKAHEVDNLYVVDGSFFPSSGAVNPALTIMANALRVGDHILERLGARAAVPVEAAQ